MHAPQHAIEQPDADDAQTPAHGGAREVLNVDEAAAFLGVSRWALYASVGRQEVPHRRVGKRILFSRRALLDWLGAGPRDAGTE